MRILIVEDNLEIVDLLRRLLERHNYTVDDYDSIALSFEAIQMVKYDAVILDRGLTDGDGIDLIKKLVLKKSLEHLPPFLILSAFGETHERIAGLNAGAIDYITKPYEPDELIARIKAHTRQNVKEVYKPITLGNIVYDHQTMSITVNNDELKLPRRQLKIFDVLIRNVGKRVTYERLEMAVYGQDEEVISNSLSSQISRLRKALKKAGATPKIKSLRWLGYVLEGHED